MGLQMLALLLLLVSSPAAATGNGSGAGSSIGVCGHPGPKLTRVAGEYANTPLAGLESAAYDAKARLWFATVNGGDGGMLEVWDFRTRSEPKYVDTITTAGLTGLPAGTSVAATSVAAREGLVAVALNANDGNEKGYVHIASPYKLGTDDGKLVEVGTLPDMVTFTPDGKTILVANEGERRPPADAEGTITCIYIHKSDDDSGDFTTTTKTANFKTVELPDGVRITKGVAPEKDIEPEYIAVSEDGKCAYATLQENNAVARIDVRKCEVTHVYPMGLQDHSKVALDVGDDGTFELAKYKNLRGMRMPDSIGTFRANGRTYIATANEGDSREGEEVKAGDLGAVDATLKGMTVTNVGINGSTLTANTDTIYSFGSRSWSILSADGELVFDSGSDFERLLLEDDNVAFFNSAHDKLDPDNRSDNKVCGKPMIFVGLERAGGVTMWDASNPSRPLCTDYVNSRVDAAGKAREQGPETIQLLPGDDEYDAYIAVPYEVFDHEGAPATGSGSFSIYGITC